MFRNKLPEKQKNSQSYHFDVNIEIEAWDPFKLKHERETKV